MTRACLHHQSYTINGQVDCRRKGAVDIQACASCSDFSRAMHVVDGHLVSRGSGYGDRLAEAFERVSGKAVTCGECKQAMHRLNTMTADEIREDLDAIAIDIANRAATIAPKWWQRIGATVAPEVAASIICDIVLNVIDRPSPPPVPSVSLTKPRRHLMFHVWPTQRGFWRWHLEQLARHRSIFNGVRTLGIVTGDGCDSPDAVREYSAHLGLRWKHVHVAENRSVGEWVSWQPMIRDVMPSYHRSNDITFYAHAKGSKSNTEAVKLWSQIMYDNCLGRLSEVEHLLRTKAMAGCFKKYGLFNTQDNNRWHFAGTFFWFRNDVLWEREWNRIDHEYFGTEAWPGLMAMPQEAACLIGENAGNLYDLKHLHAFKDVAPSTMTISA